MRTYSEIDVREFLKKYIAEKNSIPSIVLTQMVSNLTNATFRKLIYLLMDNIVTFDYLYNLNEINEFVIIKLINEKDQSAQQVTYIQFNFPKEAYNNIIKSKVDELTAQKLIDRVTNSYKIEIPTNIKYQLLQAYKKYMTSGDLPIEYIDSRSTLVNMIDNFSDPSIKTLLTNTLTELESTLFFFIEYNTEFTIKYTNLEIIYRELFTEEMVNKPDTRAIYDNTVRNAAALITDTEQHTYDEYLNYLIQAHSNMVLNFNFEQFETSTKLYNLYSTFIGLFSYMPEFLNVSKQSIYEDFYEALCQFRDMVFILQPIIFDWYISGDWKKYASQ